MSTYLNHFISTIKTIAKRYPPLYRHIYSLLLWRRSHQARLFLEIGGLFPGDERSIIEDYRLSCRYTHRDPTQITNLEAISRYICSEAVPGSFVECGTYTGGALAYAVRAFQRQGTKDRHFYGFDSFEGMPNITHEDGDVGSLWLYGKPLFLIPPELTKGQLSGSTINRATYNQCLDLLLSTSYPPENLHLIKGWFQDSLPLYRDSIGPIAVLRLDGDLYESTRVCLENLFDQVVARGIVIIDDYGTFPGCRRATDEFLEARGINPYLIYVNAGIRYFVKQ